MSWSRRASALLLAASALAACERAPPAEPVAPVPAIRPAPTLAALGELEYPLTAFDGVAVRLHAGRFESAPEVPPAERLVASAELHPLSAVGDLDGDGSADAAVVVAGNGGGSGTFLELFAVLNASGGLAPVAGPVLGDRLKIERLEVREGRIAIAYRAAEPDDPLCCPTRREKREYRIEAGRLVEVAAPTASL